MYLVELRPGNEELYRTADDLALAIRDGQVDARSRIYHRSTAKWISITLHPQYKAIVAGQREEPMARPARKAWGLFPAGVAGQPSEMSSSDAEPATGSVRHRWKRPMGLGLSSLLLVLGSQLAFSGQRPPWAGQGRPVTITRHREPAALRSDMGVAAVPGFQAERRVSAETNGGEILSLASSTTVWPVTAEPETNTITLSAPAEKTAPLLPRAPRLRTKALGSALPSEAPAPNRKANSVYALLDGYGAASERVSTRLEAGMRVARLNRLFAPARLTPGGGVTDTRRSLAGATNFIRIYRQQQAAIEKTYLDSVTQLSKFYRWTPKDVRQWYSRPVQQEPAALELITESLLATIDSVLGVLDAQAGAYKIRGTAIAFENPASGQAYGALRQRIREQIDAAVAADAATSPGPTSLLLQAIGTSALPRET